MLGLFGGYPRRQCVCVFLRQNEQHIVDSDNSVCADELILADLLSMVRVVQWRLKNEHFGC